MGTRAEGGDVETPVAGADTGRNGLTGLGPDDARECSQIRGDASPGSSEDSLLGRERSGEEADDGDEEDAILAGRRTSSDRVAGEETTVSEESSGARAFLGLSGQRARNGRGGESEGTSKRKFLESLSTCRTKREPLSSEKVKAY